MLQVVEKSKEETPVPRLAGSWPLMGHLGEFRRDPVAMLSRGWREHGDLFRFRLGPIDFALFTGPEAHDFYFRAPESQLDAKTAYKFTVPIFGRDVAYDAAPATFAEQLKFLFPCLKEAGMRRFADIMFDEASRFAGEMGDEGEIDLPVKMNELTIKIASRCLIGQEVRDQVDRGFAESYHELQNGINLVGFFFPRLPIPAHRSRDQARRKIAALFTEIIAARRGSGAAPEDFMTALMNSSYKDGRALSDDEIIGILITVLFAGQHTSAVLGAWMGVELARAHDFVSLLRREAEEVYRGTGAVSFDGLQKQTAMENTVRECERLHPPLIVLVRKALEPLSYKGGVVPAGTMAMVSPAVSHRLPGVFADPERFNPARFAPPASEMKQHHYALIGFGGGKHACMGKNFAIMQLKAIWTVLLDRFDFAAPASFPPPNYGSWVTGPKLPCRLRYRRRTEPSFFG
ncbi:MAG: cytochrome P450 [Rhodobacter sp.]|nr:cytochrome P450 [Rhodobacter sp.]MCY4169664.1 cytochrome P450 [Rhodobacter sp.]MCY4242950.1 cytochrome P450 [Rhodobacter sp.]